jgi:hypothetical protein
MFQKATKTQTYLRLCLIGPSGSGKTFSALTFAQALGQRIAVIDTEHGSSQKYADRFDFDVAVLNRHHPRDYVQAIQAAAQAGYEVLLIDSLSHAWIGRDGVLELVDTARKGQRGSEFSVWAEFTPLHNKLLDAIMAAPLHVIATLRAKTAYEIEKNERTGKNTITRLGLQPIQRDGVEYEFDIICDMTLDNTLIVSKSRMEALSGRVITRPDADVANEIAAWLRDGAPAPVGAHFSPASPAYDRDKLLARVRELAAEAQTMQVQVTVDLSTLESRTEADLLHIGQSLKAQVAQAKQAKHTTTTNGASAADAQPHAEGVTSHESTD